MATTITNVRTLEDDGVLVSAFCQQSIEFTVAGAPVGYYCEITHNGINYFRCTNTTSNTWVINMAMLSSILGIPPISITTTGLIKGVDFLIVVRNSDGTSNFTQYSSENTYLSFGIPNIGIAGGLSVININGFSAPIYHNGRYCLWNITGYAIVNSTVNYNYKTPNPDHKEIAWINQDGGWSFWNFRYLAQQTESKQSNEVPYFALTNALQIMSSYDVTNVVKLQYQFDTIAVDDEHYRQLTYLSRSPRVIYNGRVYRVKDNSSRVANCRQNLKFSLTLEIEENAVSY